MLEPHHRQLKTILWKHYKVRKRSWLLTLLEVLIPIVIFVSVAYARSKLPQFDKEFNNATYNDPETDLELSTHLNVRDTKIFFAPMTEFTDNLIREVQLKLHLYNDAIRGFRSRDDILRYYRETGDEGIITVIIFEDVGHVAPKVLKYDLQMYEELIYWETDKLFRHDIIYMPGVGSEVYIGQQFIPTQWALETSFIEMVNKTPLTTSMTFQEFPYPSHWTDNGMRNIFSYLLPLLVILSFTFLFPSILRLVVEEKNSGIKHLMNINGLKSWAYWSGWFVNGFLFCIVSVLAIVYLLTSKLFHEDFAPLEHADIWQLTVLLLLYCSATISFIFAFSTLFEKALVAMISGIIFWFVVYISFVAMATNMEVLSFDTKLLMSLLPNISLYYGIGILSDGELRGNSMGWAELPRNSNDDMSMILVMVMLTLDTIFYIILAWAFDTDPTGKYKITTCCKKSNKNFRSILRRILRRKSDNSEEDEANTKLKIPDHKHIEDYGGKVLLDIRNLTKTYGNMEALKDLNIKIYSGALTAILGHNGAGKTTAMSILAGLTKETSGNILLPESGEVDLKNRQLVSICPQENLLLPELTVKEHLQFFGLLKGLTLKEVKTEVGDLLKNKLNLYEKRHELVRKLSGGMKRKLAIGIAVLGSPKILILDEPTAGIDPEGRRAIWDLIYALKGETTILMSTHLMEEAEELADRVAIIDEGELECYGTIFYLKEKYEVGYLLTVPVDNEEQKEHIIKFTRTLSHSGVCNNKPNTLEIKCDIEGAFEAVKEIKNSGNSSPISNYKLSALMLEDIFLKIRKRKEKVTIDRRESSLSTKIDMGAAAAVGSEGEQKKSSFASHLTIILHKKCSYLYNTSLKWLPIVLIFYVLVALTFTLGDKGFKDVSQDGKTLKLRLDTYGSQHVHYSTSQPNSKLQQIFESMVNMQSSSPSRTDAVSERILERGDENLAEYKSNLIVANEFTTEDGAVTNINIMYANQAIHGAPISLNLATNTLLKLTAGDEYSIIGSNTPLRSVNTKKQNMVQSLSDNLMLWTTLLPLGALFPAMLSILLPTIERNNSVKCISFIYNIGRCSYWLGSYLLDVFIYLIIIMPVIVALYFASLAGLITLEYVAIVMFLSIFVIYGVTIIPVTYLIASWSKSVASACASFLVPNMCMSIIFVGIILTLEASEDDKADIMRSIFALNPHFTFSYLLSKFCIKMVENHNWDIKTPDQIEMICQEKPLPCCNRNSEECAVQRAYIQFSSYMVWTIIGTVICLLLVILTEYSEVLLERIRNIFGEKGQKKSNSKSDSLLNKLIKANNVTKDYIQLIPKKTAKIVKGLTFNVRKHDCFALLGVNGAGKSTTFRMLTKQERPTSGTLDVNQDKIGYCPQEHAMIGDLTGRQMLQYFARLQNHDIKEDKVDDLLKKCGLSEYADRLCKTYSGGNKRKLNTCIALIGNPGIIALDEPTTGVDPESRLKIHNLVEQAKTTSGIVYTSHSMDECEKLCNNVAIMREGTIVNGERKRIKELKEDYSAGYIIRFKLKNPTDLKEPKPDTKRITEWLRNKFFKKENVNVLEERSDVITVCVKRTSWIEVLMVADSLKKDDEMGIQDHIVQESSLEHVFLAIARDKNRTQEEMNV